VRNEKLVERICEMKSVDLLRKSFSTWKQGYLRCKLENLCQSIEHKHEIQGEIDEKWKVEDELSRQKVSLETEYKQLKAELGQKHEETSNLQEKGKTVSLSVAQLEEKLKILDDSLSTFSAQTEEFTTKIEQQNVANRQSDIHFRNLMATWKKVECDLIKEKDRCENTLLESKVAHLSLQGEEAALKRDLDGFHSEICSLSEQKEKHLSFTRDAQKKSISMASDLRKQKEQRVKRLLYLDTELRKKDEEVKILRSMLKKQEVKEAKTKERVHTETRAERHSRRKIMTLRCEKELLSRKDPEENEIFSSSPRTAHKERFIHKFDSKTFKSERKSTDFDDPIQRSIDNLHKKLLGTLIVE
ncbi:hypothetical protein ADUPG1_006101, partial [Aduncisulcus paluster]